MFSTTEFFIWFFEGLGGIGGWLVFAGISFLCALYIFISSVVRKLPALVFRLSVLLLALLVVPAIVYRFVAPETQATLEQYKEIIFYLGLIGGIVPLFVALGYTIHYAGMVVCEKGHVYDAKLGECPECILTPPPPDIAGDQDFSTEFSGGEGGSNAFPEFEPDTEAGGTHPMPYEPDTDAGGHPMPYEPDTEAGSYPMPYDGYEADTDLSPEGREFIDTQFGRIGLPLKSKKKKAQAFLLLPDNHTYQLNSGASQIGRSSDNDFVFVNEFVSRHHAKIVEEGPNLFRLHDLASANGTWLNGKKLVQSVLLEPDDEIRFGNEVIVLFLASRKR